jgi:hypothetical protein
MLGEVPRAAAACFPRTCARAACYPAPACVEKEVCVPTMVTEMRTIKCIECRPETRQQTVTVYKQVPVVQTVQRQCVEMVPEIRTQVQQCTVMKPVWRTVSQQIVVPVVTMQIQQGVRQVCRMVPMVQKKIVCEDQGQWEERPMPQTCAPRTCVPRTCAPVQTCTPVQAACKVWVPKIVQKEVELTCMKAELVSEPCQVPVQVCSYETRTCQQRVCELQPQCVQRQVQCMVCVPRTVTRSFQVTTCQCVPEQRVISQTVMVPHEVEKVVPVSVCKMVTKKVVVPECSCCGSCGMCH